MQLIFGLKIFIFILAHILPFVYVSVLVLKLHYFLKKQIIIKYFVFQPYTVINKQPITTRESSSLFNDKQVTTELINISYGFLHFSYWRIFRLALPHHGRHTSPPQPPVWRLDQSGCPRPDLTASEYRRVTFGGGIGGLPLLGGTATAGWASPR